MPMPGKAMVAATEAMLMMLPPLPADPPGRMARRPCWMPSAVPRKLTSSILRTWSAWISVNRLVISMPALLTRMSRPPRCSTASPTAFSQPSSLVTSRATKPCSSPRPLATARPASSWRSAITTVAPASANARAMPSPSPWAPPVTRALRPDSSNTLMATPRDGVTAVTTLTPCLTDVKKNLDACQAGRCARYDVPRDHGRRRRRDRSRHPTHARRQVRRAPDPAGDLGPRHPRRARLRQDVAARDRAELRVLPRRRALLLRRQVRADHPLRALLQGAVRHEVRQPGRRVHDRRRAAGALRRQAGRDAHDRGPDAPPLVRPARPGTVRRAVPPRRADDRRHPPGHDRPRRHEVRRARRPLAGRGRRHHVRPARRRVREGPARPPDRRLAGV